jgi:hypothetical protein
MRALGYDRPLYILPFDHRGSFQTKLFGWTGALTAEQTAEIAASKQVVYDGFKAAIKAGVPEQRAGILVDEQFGGAILLDARTRGYTTACSAEKSGQVEFDFEYGENFAEHIEKIQPTFCKVLVRYNSEGDQALNATQAARLRRLSDYLHSKSSSLFMFELLVPAEKTQLDRLGGDKKANFVPGSWLTPFSNFRMPELSQTSGKSRGSTVVMIAKRSSPWRARRDATRWAASFWGAARMTTKFVNGWRRPPGSQGSSALRWAAPVFGMRW